MPFDLKNPFAKVTKPCDGKSESPEDAKAFGVVLTEEIGELSNRRENVDKLLAGLPVEPNPPVVKVPKGDAEETEAAAIAAAHRLRPLGVCFSGGGIRSATFNLGVLQGLCRQGLLPYMDYLSTVSGGGYIGSWLHGVIQRQHEGNPVTAQDDLKPGRKPRAAANDPITFLRKYSNYLAPHLGIFSADTWTIAGVWLRNMALNLLILIPFLAGVMLLVRSLGLAQIRFGAQDPPLWWLWASALLAVACYVDWRLLLIVLREYKNAQPPLAAPDRPAKPPLSGTRWSWAAVIATMLAAYILGANPSLQNGQLTSGVTLGIGSSLFFLHLIFGVFGGFPVCFWKSHKEANSLTRGASLVLLVVVIPLVCAAVTSGGMILARSWLQHMTQPETQWIPITLGPALMVLVLMAGVALQIGLMGADFPDTAREWLTQFGSLLAITTVMWTGAFVWSVFCPLWMAKLALSQLPAVSTLVGGWIASGLASYFSGASSKTSGAPAGAKRTSPILEKVAVFAPPVFMALTLLLVSFGAHMAVRELAHEPHGSGCISKSDFTLRPWPMTLDRIREEYWCVLTPASPTVGTQMGWWESVAYEFPAGLEWIQQTPSHVTVVLCLACFLIAALLSLRFNINEFSMHHFYKNRLVRCYLGAGAKRRSPDRLTGFDPKDEIKISSLRATKSYNGPYPIVNCALNLNAGSELATAERKASSFIFTPSYCGAEPKKKEGELGYRTTDKFMMTGGPGLGTAMAISGAAANPNAGYHTSTPLAFLLTVFNVRLGWWVGNPGRAAQSKRSGPRFALSSLLSELFAQTDSSSRYVNLSDGGHFENLGLYELVRRRCRYIIAGDAEEDPNYSFQALGSAIRKCRADFGVEIAIDTDSLRPAKDKQFSAAHCVVGTIRYLEPPGKGQAFPMCAEAEKADEQHVQGWLVYFKASMTGDEPEDIQQYQGDHSVFPHQPTSDQFFTESQFESYRRLGEHVVEKTFERIKRPAGATAEERLLDLFQDLYRKWHPAGGEEKSGDYTERYNALMKRLADDQDLAFIGSEFFPRREPKATKGAGDDIDRKAFYFCLDVIQLMEDVYFELGFSSKSMQYNPEYAGWMKTFHIWAESPEVQRTWCFAREGYSLLFREFLEGLMSEAPTRS